MKKLIILVLSLIIILCGCTQPETVSKQEVKKDVQDIYIKSVWITYYELSDMIKNHSLEEFSSSFKEVANEIIDLGFNTITVQVRAFSDAFYYSSIFPTSSYIVDKQGDDITYDPLLVICNISKEIGLKVEAWINPYRISNKCDYSNLSNNNPAYKWKNSDNILECKSGLYYNPSKSVVTDLIVNGVEELVRNYDLYSIHFDDYFYPEIDNKQDYDDYKKSKTDLNISDWRRQNVTNMLVSVRNAINKNNPNVQFGVSPNANINENKNKLFADIERWVSDNKIIDYVCPQIYYGFKNEKMPFMFTTKKWIEISSVPVYVGLPLYKNGKVDKYAGIGKSEFLEKDIIKRQIEYLSKLDSVKGIYVFSYSQIKGNEDQLQKLKEI